jgi:hypothetical protein
MSPVKRRDSASSSLLRSMFESETARLLSPTRHIPKSTQGQGQGQGGSHAVRSLLGYSPEVVPLLSHEYVFWMGDLNYRIDHISTDEVLRRIKENRLDTLIISDQLYIERQKQNCFTGFREGPLSFNPTYKYEPGTDEYEKREGKPLRAPAWCDRILWKCQHSEGDVTLMHYRAAPGTHSTYTMNHHLSPVTSHSCTPTPLSLPPSLPPPHTHHTHHTRPLPPSSPAYL